MISCQNKDCTDKKCYGCLCYQEYERQIESLQKQVDGLFNIVVDLRNYVVYGTEDILDAKRVSESCLEKAQSILNGKR